MILGGAMTHDEARLALGGGLDAVKAIPPVTPYLYHHVVQAMVRCGLEENAQRLIEDYWVGMIRRGATPFWELHDPEREFLSVRRQPSSQ